MYCDNCGARIDDDSAFCENCGVLIERDKPIVSGTGNTVDKETEKIQPITSLEQLMEDDDQGELTEEPVEESFAQTEPDDQRELEPPEPTAEENDEEPEQDSDNLMEETEEPEEPVAATFCMACGRRLPKGAAFCDACGTPTGEVVPTAIHMRSTKQGIFVKLVKGFFVKPAETIEKAAGEDSFFSGVGFFLIKDLLVAILAAIFMSGLMTVLGGLGALITGGDVVGFGARIFLIAVLMDALWVGILYGAGLLFRGKGSFKALVGACGTASIFSGVLLILTIVLMGIFPAATVCALIVMAAAQIIVMSKAVEATMKVSDNLRIYMMPASVLCFAVIMSLVAWIFS